MSLDETIAREVAERVAPLLLDRVLDLADPCLTPKQAASYLSISKRTLADSDIPRCYPTPGTPRYRLSTLNQHIACGKV